MAGKILLLLVVGFQIFSCRSADLPRFSCTKSPSSKDIDAKVPGEIVSPGYPGRYGNNEDCTWRLKAPLGSVVRLTITKLDLEQKDFLSISDGETPLSRNLIGKYSLCMKGPLSLFSTGRFMHLKFTSSASEVKEGFRIEFKTVRKDKIITGGKVHTMCSFISVIRGASGYIAHPGFPGSVMRPVQCLWNVKGTSGKSLHLSYKMIGLIPSTAFGSCDFDYIRQKYRTQSGETKFCGCDLPKNSKGPTGDEAFAELMTTTTRSFYQPGFLLHYKQMDPSTCPKPESCALLNDDRNIGFDRDANIKFEEKVIPTTTSAPTTTVIPKIEPMGPFHVECNRDEMKVALNFTNWPLLVQESATLIDPNCKAYQEDATHIYIKTPLDQCGTYHNYSSDGRYVIYYNEFLIERQGVKPGDIITRDHLATFKFECRYHRRAVLSVVHFTPARARVFTTTANWGNFTYMMRLFKTEEYDNAYDDYPVEILANKMIFVQTEVQANDSELILLVEHCKVTPSEDYNDKEFYVLIEEGCETDSTLRYNHKISSKQRFNFKSFYFEKDRDASIHIHCKVRVCRKLDKNSRCMKGCPYSKRRRRAADANEETEITGMLSIGPIDVQEDSQTGSLRGSDSPRMFVEIIVGVLGFVVFALLIAVSIVLWKKRQERNKSILTLIVEDNEQ